MAALTSYRKPWDDGDDAETEETSTSCMTLAHAVAIGSKKNNCASIPCNLLMQGDCCACNEMHGARLGSRRNSA